MNIYRIPAAIALVFAASACNPTITMLENAPQAPAPAYDVELSVFNGDAEMPAAPQAPGPDYNDEKPHAVPQAPVAEQQSTATVGP